MTLYSIFREDFLFMPMLHTPQAMRFIGEAAAETISKLKEDK